MRCLLIAAAANGIIITIDYSPDNMGLVALRCLAQLK